VVALTLSSRLAQVEGSPTLALSAKAKALAKTGKPVVDFTAGEPDSSTPEHIKQAGIRAIESNKTRYTAVEGTIELREAIAAQASKRLGVAYQSGQVLVSCGAKHSLYNIFQAICDPQDEVIVFSPYWVSYPPMVRLAGGVPVIVPTRCEDQFQPNLDAVRASLSPRTRAIVVNSPSNPTGVVIRRACLEGLARLAAERDLFLISDEIYSELVFPPATHFSIAQAGQDAAERTFVVDGVSKSYSMTGWRIGYTLGPKPVIEAMSRIQSHSTSNPTTISQYAALEALSGPQESLALMNKHFQRRRDLIVDGLNAISPLRCFLAEGAFYAWCNVEGLGQSSEAIALRWLEDAWVATVPGEGFGAPGWVRLSFATDDAMIREGIDRIARWVKQQGRAA
jgi:aspartate aminotransferase